MGGHQTIDVRLEPAHAGWRLDRALAAAVPTLSRERLKALIRSGAVEAQGAAVRDPATKVKGDESFRVAVPEPTPAHNEPQDIPLTIVFEDEHLLVVDKPRAWWSTRPREILTERWSTRCCTIAAARCRGSAGSPGPASSTASTRTRRGFWSSLRPMSPTKGWRSNSPRTSIDRRYLAIVSGVPKTSGGYIDAPLARSSANRKKIAIVKDGRAASAP